jgi:transposase
MLYTEDFKRTIVKRMLMPGSKGVLELSREIGVSTQTLYNWRDKYSRAEDIIRSPRQWNSKDKYTAVIESAHLSGIELGRWLRKNGLKNEHLDIWKKEIGKMVSSKKEKDELRKAKKRIKELEKELQKKDKALAEISALLVLKKKANAIWGEEDE